MHNMEFYFETISTEQLTQMYDNEEISFKCFNRVCDDITMAKAWNNKFSLIDLGTFIGVVIHDGSNEIVKHVNKYLI